MNNRYEEIMDSVDDLRERLVNLIMNKPQALNRTANEIGIGALTLARFIRTTKPISFATACKVKKYVEEQEAPREKG